MMKFFILLFCSFLLSSCAFLSKTKNVQGCLTIGHEVRAFKDYQTNKEYWIVDRSGGLVKKYYETVGTHTVNYKPIFAILKVSETCEPQNGFANEYDGCYVLQEIISLSDNE